MKKLIVSVLAIAGVCCYLDKTDKSLDDITSNDNVKSTFENMKKAGNYINNNEVVNNVKDTVITIADDVRNSPEAKKVADNVVTTVGEFIDKLRQRNIR